MDNKHGIRIRRKSTIITTTKYYNSIQFNSSKVSKEERKKRERVEMKKTAFRFFSLLSFKTSFRYFNSRSFKYLFYYKLDLFYVMKFLILIKK